MSNLINFDYNGQTIQKRDSDGYINLTQMCQANGKRIDKWKELKATKAYIEELQCQSPEKGVLDSGVGGDHSGTWGHPSLAINLARWISPAFAVWCDAHIFNLMESGSTSLEVDPIEEMKLKIELTKLENQKVQAEYDLIRFRHTVTQTCPEPVQQKVLGYHTVEKVEYRDRVIKDDDVVRDGSTVNKTELCHRYGIVTRNGKPDYKRLNQLLSRLPEEAWDEQISIRQNHEVKREYLDFLDHLVFRSDRQINLGEAQ